MKKILFTTAYGKHSKNVWKYTLQLAKYFQASITLLHVYNQDTLAEIIDEERYLDFDYADYTPELSEDQYLEELQDAKVFAEENTSKSFKGIPLNFHISKGFIANTILETQVSKGFDLVVMGTAQERFTDRLFGSVALKVLNDATCPVLLIPPNSTFWGIKKIIYTTNFEPHDRKAIDYLMEWSKAFGSTVHLLHVYPNALAGKLAIEKMNALMKSFERTEEWDYLTFQLLPGDKAKVIEEYRAFTGSDMIALFPQKRRFFSKIFDASLTKQLAKETLIPLLVLKNK